MNRAFLSLACGCALAFTSFAQTPSHPNEGLTLIKIGTDMYGVTWLGRPGIAYFLQYSEDFVTWHQFPDDVLGLVVGGGVAISGGICVCGPERFFVRLKYPELPLADPYYGDIDGDKVSNRDEVLSGTDPFSIADSDSDGMTDDWETRFGLNRLNAADAALDNDGDNISNYDEYQSGTFGTDPTDYYNGNYPTIVTVGWSVPWDEPGTLVVEPLIFEFKFGVNPAVDVPVQIYVEYPGTGQISLNNNGTGLADSLNLRTDASGHVQVYFKHSTAIPPVPTPRPIVAHVGSMIPGGSANVARALAFVQSDYSYPAGTVGRNATEAIDSRINPIATVDAPNAKLIYSTQIHGTPQNPIPTYVRNTASWCYDLRQQMTCISPWNSLGFSARGGTAITAQHVINSAHFPLENGRTIRFITANNQIITKTIVGTANHPNPGPYTDFTVYTLNEPLPASITPCKLLPANYANYLSYLENGRPPVMLLDKEEKALVWELLVLGGNAWFVGPGLHRKRVEFFEPLETDDSSNPEFLILNDTLVLLCTTTGTNLDSTAGEFVCNASFLTPHIATLNAMIAAADADATASDPANPINTGLQVQTVDLSGFSTFTPP